MTKEERAKKHYKANGQIAEAVREWRAVTAMKAVWDYEKPMIEEARRKLAEHAAE
jgi:hypothetical protein